MTNMPLMILSLLALAGTLAVYRGLVRQLRSAELKSARALQDGPSISVCIPARNEAHALARCLERVLASDYKKLEVLVLDDNSDDETSILIKSFAHAGVRFIAGKPLPAGWLGKNHALDTMAREASGELILFMDVDTAIEPTTISRLAGQYEQRKLMMLSVIPGRQDTFRASVLLGSLRYFWELLLATPVRPATSSALWMIDRRMLLEDYSGFETLKAYVQPEAVLAARVQQQKAYEVLTGAPLLGAYYEKRWASQIETSERLLYPRFIHSHGAAAVLLLSLLWWVLAAICLIVGLIQGEIAPSLFAAAAVIAGFLTYYQYLCATWTSRRLLGILMWPYVVVQEVWLIIMSVLRYKTGRVVWKGRPVTAAGDNHDALVIDE